MGVLGVVILKDLYLNNAWLVRHRSLRRSVARINKTFAVKDNREYVDPDHTGCQSLGFMSFDLGISLNAIIAIGTAVTAIVAWRAASVAKSAAAESSKIAKEQTDALITAAKANALASRIHAYDLQIAVI